jgi:hypothetical protein
VGSTGFNTNLLSTAEQFPWSGQCMTLPVLDASWIYLQPALEWELYWSSHFLLSSKQASRLLSESQHTALHCLRRARWC